MAKLFLLQKFGKRVGQTDQGEFTTQLLYTSAPMTIEDCEDIKDLMNTIISNKRAMMPKSCIADKPKTEPEQ